MKVLLSGAAGQLGQALRQHQPAGVELIATSRSSCVGGHGERSNREVVEGIGSALDALRPVGRVPLMT